MEKSHLTMLYKKSNNNFQMKLWKNYIKWVESNVGQPGSKERIDFGQNIGNAKDQAGNSTPTTKGIVHYAKDGSHIIPSNP